MTTVLLCLIPVLIMPWILRFVFPHKIQWLEMFLILVIGSLVSGGIYAAGMFSATADIEILNGQVTGKERKHDTYEQAYQCFCTTDAKGNSTCQTCYETHYTVEWKVFSNVGTFVIDKKDSTSRRVYNLSDPTFFTQAKNGDPVAKQHTHTNYVKAAPDSLVRAWDIKKFESMIPAYPSDVYNFYSLNRALQVGVTVPDINAWNTDISNALRVLGPQCQANVIVVFAKADQSFMNALEGKWLNGKKNDIIVVLGINEYPKIEWVGVSSWTKSELFKVKLRDDIMEIGTVDRAQIMQTIEANTKTLFKRREMKDFEYLKYEIEPPTWVLILSIILGMMASLGASYYFYHNDLVFTSGYGRRSYSRFKRF